MLLRLTSVAHCVPAVERQGIGRWSTLNTSRLVALQYQVSTKADQYAAAQSFHHSGNAA